MSFAKIKVPEGMLKAALKHLDYAHDDSGIIELVTRHTLRDALLWQRENAPMPTDADIAAIEMTDKKKDDARYIHGTRFVCLEWIRRMYDVPETEVHPVLKEWLEDCEAKHVDEATKVNFRRLFDRAFEAGKKAASE